MITCKGVDSTSEAFVVQDKRHLISFRGNSKVIDNLSGACPMIDFVSSMLEKNADNLLSNMKGNFSNTKKSVDHRLFNPFNPCTLIL